MSVLIAFLFVTVFFAITMHGVYRVHQLMQELGIDYLKPSTWTAEYWWRVLKLSIPYNLAFVALLICALLLL